MVDIVLLAGKLLLLALLYLFLFAAVRAGMGLVSRGRSESGSSAFALKVVTGPKEIRGISVPVSGPIVIGRAPGTDIVIADDFISSQHARAVPATDGIILEDLDSTNGTIVNGNDLRTPTRLSAGDEIDLGGTRIKVVRV